MLKERVYSSNKLDANLTESQNVLPRELRRKRATIFEWHKDFRIKVTDEITSIFWSGVRKQVLLNETSFWWRSRENNLKSPVCESVRCYHTSRMNSSVTRFCHCPSVFVDIACSYCKDLEIISAVTWVQFRMQHQFLKQCDHQSKTFNGYFCKSSTWSISALR
jgi:hypothetical protein